MNKFNFSDIDTAFEHVNSSIDEDVIIILRKDTGEMLIRSEENNNDVVELEKEIGSELLVYIPKTNDLDLGKQLVFNFASEKLSNAYGTVRGMFHHRGAYRKFKELLERKGKINEWHEYRLQKQEDALRAWCEENGILLSS